MADYAALSARGGAGGRSGGADPRRRGADAPAGEPSRQEIQGILAQFDAKINQMQDYPAKDVINALTKLAERVEYAPEIVSFLETKIHRVPPNYKLPIFYLTDSILKNVRGPYGGLLARKIVPLYCNCVKQVSGKDLRRFVHVLNTWDQTRIFPVDALAQMRTAANRAMEAAGEPATSVVQPAVTFANEPPPARRAPPAAAQQPQQKQHDMELRSLLTHMQNDMGIHPTEHLSLEQVRVQNPEWYNQLVEYHAASKQPALETVPPVNNAMPPQPVQPQPQRAGTGLLPVPAGPPVQVPPPQPVRPAPRQPRRSRFSDVPPPGVLPQPVAHAPPQQPAKSANVAHLMDLLNRKKTAPPPTGPQPTEITNEHPRGSTPNAAAVMSILQKLKGLNGQAAQSTQGTPTQVSATMPTGNDGSASKMWFSDKIVAHKDRVESNVQKLYAALPLVCRESGLRFKEQEKLNAHLDFLFQYNRSQKERGKGGVSRSWYPDEDQWAMDYSGEVAPREATSSSFFDRKNEVEEETTDQFETARVPVDEGVTHCRICGENFVKSWDEEEEDWMYTNAVYGTIHNPDGAEQKTIFHKYCYDTVMANSKHITPEHLIPGTPQSLKSGGSSLTADIGGVKRNLNEESDSDDEDDMKRIKRE